MKRTARIIVATLAATTAIISAGAPAASAAQRPQGSLTIETIALLPVHQEHMPMVGRAILTYDSLKKRTSAQVILPAKTVNGRRLSVNVTNAPCGRSGTLITTFSFKQAAHAVTTATASGGFSAMYRFRHWSVAVIAVPTGRHAYRIACGNVF